MDKITTFSLFMIGQFNFFLANWMEYYTHVLNTQFYNLGVTEVELICFGINFVTYLKG